VNYVHDTQNSYQNSAYSDSSSIANQAEGAINTPSNSSENDFQPNNSATPGYLAEQEFLDQNIHDITSKT